MVLNKYLQKEGKKEKKKEGRKEGRKEKEREECVSYLKTMTTWQDISSLVKLRKHPHPGSRPFSSVYTFLFPPGTSGHLG